MSIYSHQNFAKSTDASDARTRASTDEEEQSEQSTDANDPSPIVGIEDHQASDHMDSCSIPFARPEPRWLDLTILPLYFRAPPRAVLGCIQVPNDFTLDEEGPLMMKKFPGVEIRMTKLKLDSEEVTSETYSNAAFSGCLAYATATLMPTHRCTAIGLSCTSMSFTIGPDVVDQQLGSMGCQKTTDMARGLVAAIRALGLKRISVVLPYVQGLAADGVNMLKASGVVVVACAAMGLVSADDISAVNDDTVVEWAKAVNCPEAEGVVICCSCFRVTSPGFISDLEEKLGKPVITSQQAFLWSMLRLAGVNDQVEGYGRLLSSR